ncbi:MAG: hypothetical protein QGG36_07605 [Pirellulaceae bacterium]|nr:hypothetical protein [Pirellulaceae bacterium]MDP7015649.1 hypothetical protein [Pirellulaceae bacterium]
MRCSKRLLRLLLVPLAAIVVAQSAHAAMLLRARVVRDDEVVMTAIMTGHGGQSMAHHWRHMAGAEFEVAEGVEFTVPADGKIDGPLQLELWHSSSTRLATARLDSLQLNPVAGGWSLSNEEMSRTARIAQIPLPPPNSIARVNWLPIGAVLPGVVALAGVVAVAVVVGLGMRSRTAVAK